MNILLVENRGAALYYVVEWLKKEGHVVLDAFNPNDAQSRWDKRKEAPIHCILLDLNLPTDGLSNKQRERSAGGFLSGWVWLHDVVLREAPEMRQRTTIYSDYIPTLKENVPEEEYKDIKLIPKRRRSSSARDVTARVREIARMTPGKNSSQSLEAES